MALENPAFEDVFPFETWGILHCHVSFRGCNLFFFFSDWYMKTQMHKFSQLPFFPSHIGKLRIVVDLLHLPCGKYPRKHPDIFVGTNLSRWKIPAFARLGNAISFPRGSYDMHKMSHLTDTKQQSQQQNLQMSSWTRRCLRAFVWTWASALFFFGL